MNVDGTVSLTNLTSVIGRILALKTGINVACNAATLTPAYSE